MSEIMRIGTRESELAVWQATQVKQLLESHGFATVLVTVKSEGDLDLKTPLYAMGVQGIFTRSLDIALLNRQIDIAVHSMKDVPVQLPAGLVQAAVLPRGPVNDLLVYKKDLDFLHNNTPAIIATSSIRRKAQWLHRYPQHTIADLRGNVNTRLKKLMTSSWQGAVFAQAGLERINARPANAVELDWMLPAPAQGAIMVVCREADLRVLNGCKLFHDTTTSICTGIERDFLKTLMGGCATPIGAYACIRNGRVFFEGNILSTDGKEQASVSKESDIEQAAGLGIMAAKELLAKGGQPILDKMRAEDLNN